MSAVYYPCNIWDVYVGSTVLLTAAAVPVKLLQLDPML